MTSLPLTALDALRLRDFERTQLLALSTELEALAFLNRLLERFTPGISSKSAEATEDDGASLWTSERRWYHVLWLSFYPFLNWIVHFSGVMSYLSLRHPLLIFKMRLQILRWFFLLIAAPILATLSVLWNLLYYYTPGLIFLLMKGGAYVSITPDMTHNVDVGQALREMADPQIRQYSQAIAEFLLMVSAITYTRDSRGYARAETAYRRLAAKEGKPLPKGPILAEMPEESRRFVDMLRYSETILRQYAALVDLEASVISELDSGFGGPTASLFVSAAHSVMVVGVRGTNPFDAREILLDAAFEKVAADPDQFDFLHHSESEGYLHRGFYSSLFSLSNKTHFPALRIREAVMARAAILRSQDPAGRKVQLFITGHSLGAAIASILTATFSDLGPDIELRDTYLYGTPMSSNSRFCQAYRGEDVRNIWRVIDGGDFVTKIPPSLNVVRSDGGIGQMMDYDKALDGTIIDYSAIGHGVRYHFSGRNPEGFDDVEVICNLPICKTEAPVWWIRLLLLTPLRDIAEHSPRSYSVSLKRARAAMLQRISDSGHT